MTYDIALICKNGHLINSYYRKYPEDNASFCNSCGAPTIHQCTNCNAEIKGHSTGEYSYLSTYSVPAFCSSCGFPYPWTKAAIENAALILEEEENFSEQFRTSISECLPDIICETPKSQIAIVRMKKALSSAGKFTSDALRQFVIDFGSELAKKSLGL